MTGTKRPNTGNTAQAAPKSQSDNATANKSTAK